MTEVEISWRRLQPAVKGDLPISVLLAVVAIMGFVLATAGEVWHMALKREKEQELLFVGDQFRRAFTLYVCIRRAMPGVTR